MKEERSNPADPGRRSFLTGGFLRPAAAGPERPAEGGPAILDRNTCIAWNGVICIACVDPCRPRAIRMDARGRPSVDPAACTGCADCVDVCPARAIRAAPPHVESDKFTGSCRKT